MPRDHQDPPSRHHVEHRDPRAARRPHDDDVRMERRDLYRDLPSVSNRDFAPISAGDGFGYAGQGGYGESLRMGGYAGVGPADSWRSDERIEEILHERLTGADTINATAVLPVVTEGVVTLNGWVPERSMKHAAEETAWQIAGVKDVHNRLTVGESAAAFGPPGEAVRSGKDQVGSGFSSSDRVDIDERHIGDADSQSSST